VAKRSSRLRAGIHADTGLLIIEGSNHNVMLDKPDEFDLALDLFLDRVFA
jgi:pimeloyl-ACP methyl ester carboxylesterase